MAPETMLEQALDFPRQLASGLAAAEAAGIPAAGPQAVALCGLGGSAAGGRLLAALFADQLAVPVVPVDTTSLPGWIGADTLVVCTSYSGATAETRPINHAAPICESSRSSCRRLNRVGPTRILSV